MIKQLKSITVNVLAGANIAIVLLMLAVGFSHRFSPADWAVLGWAGLTFPFFLLLNLGFLVFWVMFHWRKAWIPLVGFFFVYAPVRIYMPVNQEKEVPDSCLKIISYNVCAYGGNFKYEDGFGAVYSFLEAQQADIVCLQEDVDSWRRYVVQRYQKIYPYNDTTVFIRSPHSFNAVGVHTRFPILRKERLPLPSKANGAVAYYLQLSPADTLLLLNVHLESNHLSSEDRAMYKALLKNGMKGEVKGDTVKAESRYLLGKLTDAARKRAPQAELLHDYIAAHSQYPLLVCGDFNDNPLSYSHYKVAEGLTDCFTESGRGFGWSYNQNGFFFRIDNILCSSHFEPLKCQVDSKIDFSDHYPMICWLKMRDKP
ncbi:MAG: endonuclease/exonuclease/phosphatase family protein [Prevotella sp.]|nr:endonuclease/exonuclease/phosphatase family protein [Prevotella sp.]